jgi:hypothetical protein
MISRWAITWCSGTAASNPSSKLVTGQNAAAATGDNPVLDPLGAAAVRQRLLPLDERIDRFEQVKLPKRGPNRFRITKLTLRPDEGPGAPSLTQFPPVLDNFARGQFQDLSDAAKLSLPAFELMTSGAKVASDAVETGRVVPCPTDYETLIIDGPDTADTEIPQGYIPDPVLTAKLSRRGVAVLGGLGAGGTDRFFAGVGTLVKTFTAREDFTIATVGGLQAQDTLLGTIRQRMGGLVTKGRARDFLREHLDANPDQRGQLQVVPKIELPQAA